MNSRFCIAALAFSLLTAVTAIAGPPIQSGDRVAIIGNTFADQLRIHGYLETKLLLHYRENPVSIRNLGWGGDMLTARDRPTGFPAEDATLKAHRTDVIIACFGMGESFAGERGVEEFKTRLKAFVASHEGKKYNGRTDVRLILVSPIAYEDLGELTPGRERRNRELRVYSQAMQDVATDTRTPFINLFDASLYLMNEPVGADLTTNGIHLNSYGYWAISHTFCNQLTGGAEGTDRKPWLLRIDAAKGTGDARGVSISSLAADENGLSFQATEKSPPALRPPVDQKLPPQLESIRDTLIVDNLKPGKYRLTIDKKTIATATAQSWAKGVPIDSSPAHQAALAYRAIVNDKNLQFTYSWKALNQVHIVGERRGSPSGRSLPGEVVEFNRLANDRERVLKKGFKLTTRKWRVSRISQ